MELSQLQQRLSKALDHLQSQFAGLQVWRANSALVDNISVTVSYGVMKINQLANVVVLDAQTLKVEPWDKTITASIEKAIYDADTWLTPRNEWEYIMISIPPLTTERRQEIVKQVSKMGEEAKIVVRQVRQDALKDIKHLHDEKELSDDQKKWEERKVDEVVKEYNTKIDQLVKVKWEEIMQVW